MSKINELEHVKTSTSVDTATDSADTGVTIDAAAGRSSPAELEPPDPPMEPDGCHGDRGLRSVPIKIKRDWLFIASPPLPPPVKQNHAYMQIQHGWLLKNYTYNAETGVFARRATGKPVGARNKVTGYVMVGVSGDGATYATTAHRLAWFYSYGVWPEGVVDHIDGIRTNNALQNLRDVSQAENLKNNTSSRRKAA